MTRTARWLLASVLLAILAVPLAFTLLFGVAGCDDLVCERRIGNASWLIIVANVAGFVASLLIAIIGPKDRLAAHETRPFLISQAGLTVAGVFISATASGTSVL